MESATAWVWGNGMFVVNIAASSVAVCRVLLRERFLNEKSLHPYGWFPFGGGNRRCIGMNFALFEMKILLASILPRVELELVPGQDFKPERLGLALSPKTGVDVIVKAVKPSPMTVPELVYQ